MLNIALLSLLMRSSPQAQYGTPSTSHNTTQTGSKKSCPWLTEGSAAKVLGGDVSVTVNVPDTGVGSCKFSRLQGSSDSLEIFVSKAALPACPAGSTMLQGVGNEAEQCKPPGSRNEAVEMVSSRVRDLHFNVTLTSRRQKSPAKSSDPQEDLLEQIAEQIAGNLY